ncbi:cobyric acid synthase [Haloarchaeobius sp. TZWSO28]|uniref:cobyric acid synthase n=1 Tax=Haloarchaeobius sp. TZWSO28 TaxID=3446119 RepID=UPI003EC0B39F
MTHTVLVAGTASHVGKSTVVAGLCRLLADRGVSVAPFKAQNMSNNAHVAPTPDGEWGEIGVSQYVQARAARIQPTTDVNPVLLKPRGDGESQLVIDGQAVGHFEAGSYYAEHWEEARGAAEGAYRRLAAKHDVILAEGAGSIAEINLHDRDLANVETARFADVDILLVADIERGGVFASLVGTLELVPEDIREQVAGVVITKFRGDLDILQPGLDAFEDRTGVPVLGVVPYDDPGLPEEDSVALPPVGERRVDGADDHPDPVRIGVPRLPRVSNATDLQPLAREHGVRVVYLPLDDGLSDVDAVVIPGTKNTVDDLRALLEAGFDEALRAFEGPIVGLCGGYQLLGECIENAHVEGTGTERTVDGVGRLPVVTRFDHEKQVRPATYDLAGVGPLAGAEGPVSGYEIHAGETVATGDVMTPFAVDGDASAALGAATDDVCGTYLHGLFENRSARRAFLERLGVDPGDTGEGTVTDSADRAAAMVADSVDFSGVFPTSEATGNRSSDGRNV